MGSEFARLGPKLVKKASNEADITQISTNQGQIGFMGA